MPQQLCFIDMDGVLVDFVGGILPLHGTDINKFFSNPTNIAEWSLEKGLGISGTEFWSVLNKLSYEEDEKFWATLPILPDAKEIVSTCQRMVGEGNVAILSAPSKDPGCVNGKKKWINQYFPFLKDSLIFTKAKQFLAGKNRLLIDDNSTNCANFAVAKGSSFLVPQLWNVNWRRRDQTIGNLNEWFNQVLNG